MRYFLDTETNGFGGDLISLALVRDDGASLYLAAPCPAPIPWVADNILPVIDVGESPISALAGDFWRHIGAFVRGDRAISFVADWPDDIRYLCGCLMPVPGKMLTLGDIRFELVRADVYPITLEGAVRHNALWDARALRHAMTTPAPA